MGPLFMVSSRSLPKETSRKLAKYQELVNEVE